jgi:hypothetical protein
MFVIALLVVLSLAATCAYFLKGWRGFLLVAVLLLLTLIGGVVAIGEGALLVAAYGGGPVLVAAALGYALGARFRPDDDAA